MSNNSQNIMDEFKNASGNASVKANRKLKVGIIGTGWIAGAHALELKKMEDVEITCLADLVPGKAEQFAKDNGIEYLEIPYRDFRKISEILEAFLQDG